SERASAMGKRSGMARRDKRPLSEDETADMLREHPLDSVEGVQGLLARLIPLAIRGRIPPAAAQATGRLAEILLRSFSIAQAEAKAGGPTHEDWLAELQAEPESPTPPPALLVDPPLPVPVPAPAELEPTESATAEAPAAESPKPEPEPVNYEWERLKQRFGPHVPEPGTEAHKEWMIRLDRYGISGP